VRYSRNIVGTFPPVRLWVPSGRNTVLRADLVLHLLLVVALPCAAIADSELPIDPRSLVEVHTLEALPKEVISLLGRQKADTLGIADVREKFNATDVVLDHVPRRRFLVAGASSLCALVAYEQGGHSLSFHAAAFSLGASGWSQVGQWTLKEEPRRLREILEAIDGKSDPWSRGTRFPERILRASPARRDGPLRELNLSDIEVREIQAVVLRVLPGSILNISGVVTGCPCEEGPGCADQVWIVAHRAGITQGLQLSRINGRWALGVVQQWWMDREKLEQWWSDSGRGKTGRTHSEFVAYAKAVQALNDRFPVCATEPTEAAAPAAANKRP
jgi:hypothetical protein